MHPFFNNIVWNDILEKKHKFNEVQEFQYFEIAAD